MRQLIDKKKCIGQDSPNTRNKSVNDGKLVIFVQPGDGLLVHFPTKQCNCNLQSARVSCPVYEQTAPPPVTWRHWTAPTVCAAAGVSSRGGPGCGDTWQATLVARPLPAAWLEPARASSSKTTLYHKYHACTGVSKPGRSSSTAPGCRDGAPALLWVSRFAQSLWVERRVASALAAKQRCPPRPWCCPAQRHDGQTLAVHYAANTEEPERHHSVYLRGGLHGECRRTGHGPWIRNCAFV